MHMLGPNFPIGLEACAAAFVSVARFHRNVGLMGPQSRRDTRRGLRSRLSILGLDGGLDIIEALQSFDADHLASGFEGTPSSSFRLFYLQFVCCFFSRSQPVHLSCSTLPLNHKGKTNPKSWT